MIGSIGTLRKLVASLSIATYTPIQTYLEMQLAECIEWVEIVNDLRKRGEQ